MANQVKAGYGKVLSVKQITATKPFKQPRIGNLGTYAHPPRREHHVTTKAKRPAGDDYNPQHNPDYKPRVAPKKNIRTTEMNVAGPNQGTSDVKSEGIGPDLGPLLGTPRPFKPVATPKRQMAKGKVTNMGGTPFFGGR